MIFFISNSEHFKDNLTLAIDAVNLILYLKNRTLMAIQICASLQHEIYENGYLTNIDKTTVISNV